MESITSLTLLVAAGTAVAAWVVLGSPRISYAGVQIAFAFYVCVIQGFAPTWYFYTIRDRLMGILLGNVVITLVFHYVWPVRASDAHVEESRLGAASHGTARHGRQPERRSDGGRRANGSLRAQAADRFRDRTAVGGRRGVRVAGERRSRTAGRTRAVAARRDRRAVRVPDPVGPRASTASHRSRRSCRRALSPRRAASTQWSANSLDVDRRSGAGRAVSRPSRPARLSQRWPPIIRGADPAIANPEVARQIEGRLALYRELVPRLERLGVRVLPGDSSERPSDQRGRRVLFCWR